MSRVWLKPNLPGINCTLYHFFLGHALMIFTSLFWKRSYKKQTNKNIVKIIKVFSKPRNPQYFVNVQHASKPTAPLCKNHVSMYVSVHLPVFYLLFIDMHIIKKYFILWNYLFDIKLISFLIAKLIYLLPNKYHNSYLLDLLGSQKQKYLANFSSSTFKITSFNDQ